MNQIGSKCVRTRDITRCGDRVIVILVMGNHISCSRVERTIMCQYTSIIALGTEVEQDTHVKN